MEVSVIGLVGSSGTGKSHMAASLAKEMQLEAIIDDGLLIAGNRIMAGRSAKAERSRMAAVRRAIFQDEAHAKEVRAALGRVKAQRLLVLGTSEAMILRICQALELPQPTLFVAIEEVASIDEIQEARLQREDAGTHVIPVGFTEVRRLIPVVLADALDSMLRRGESEARLLERTQVKPLFGGSGRPLQLAMVRPLIEQAIEDSGPQLFSLLQASLQQRPQLVLSLELAARIAAFDLELLKAMQLQIRERIHAATGRSIEQVELSISAVLS